MFRVPAGFLTHLKTTLLTISFKTADNLVNQLFLIMKRLSAIVKKSSLEGKLLILVFGTLFVVLVGVGHLVFNGSNSYLVSQKEESLEDLTRALAIVAPATAKGSDTELLERWSQNIRETQPDLEYLVISDKSGRTLYADSKHLRTKHNCSLGTAWWTTARKILGYGHIDPSNIYTVSVPVKLTDGRRVTFTAGYNMQRLNTYVESAQNRTILGISLGLIVGTILSLLIGRAISDTLKKLEKGADAISKGDLEFRLSDLPYVELDRLSQSFNCMVETLNSSYSKLTEQANKDPLTGLYNHRHFQERLASEVSRANRYAHVLSLLMIDIDFFKNFNDAYGHPAGDAALVNLAEILRAKIRDTDIPARYGGEEFAVILPETDVHDAELIAERIRKAVEVNGLIEDRKDRAPLTVSIGIATYPIHCIDNVSLIETADSALYKSKSQGRNKVSIYDSELQEDVPKDNYKLCVLLQAHDLPTIEALSSAVDAKLGLPLGHSKSVGKLASVTARKLGFSAADCAGIYLAALLRDLGQISIPDWILHKESTLSSEEMAMLKEHSALGHAIIQKAPRMSAMLPAILHHHERYDGTGYPSGLSGEDIPLPARILAAADAYQSMMCERPHRPAKSENEAREELIKNSGTQFDPKVVEAMLSVISKRQSSSKNKNHKAA